MQALLKPFSMYGLGKHPRYSAQNMLIVVGTHLLLFGHYSRRLLVFPVCSGRSQPSNHNMEEGS